MWAATVSMAFIFSALFGRQPCVRAGADPEVGQGGPQLRRPYVANIVEWSHTSELSVARPWKLLDF